MRQGESRFAKENEFLGEFLVDNLALRDDGRGEVEVMFRIDGNGMLNVTALDTISKRKIKIQMRNYGEFIREELANINDAVVDKFNGIMKAEEQKRIEEATPKISDTNFLDYTPVNKETVGAWCKNFLEEMKQLEDAEKTE